MDAKHTPGPWIAVGRTILAQRAGGNRSVAICYSRGMDSLCEIDTYEEVEQNACLIAAAPEMLEALKRVTKKLDGYTHTSPLEGHGEIIAYAKTVITKAEGR